MPDFNHYFLLLAYDGTAYRGWQRQPGGVITVQETIENLLSKVHHREVTLGGCGRTDAGVHATQYYAYLRTDEALPLNYRFFINKQLPADISLLEVFRVSDKAQARYDATGRTYDYFFHNQHTSVDPFQKRTSATLNLSSFSTQPCLAALPLLLKYNDYRAFCKTPDRHNTTIVHFTEASLFYNREHSRYRFRFKANRFLRGMIRLLVNDLMLIGTEKLSLEAFEQMLKSGEREPHFRLAPPEGLFLTGVEYPYIDREAVLPVSGREEWVELSLSKPPPPKFDLDNAVTFYLRNSTDKPKWLWVEVLGYGQEMDPQTDYKLVTNDKDYTLEYADNEITITLEGSFDFIIYKRPIPPKGHPWGRWVLDWDNVL